jgi:glycine/D-amino acid oxidase-like deaminating enzyme
MSAAVSRSYDVVIAGAGIVGAACALACAEAGLRVALVERDFVGSGATSAGMGHIVVMDDSEAQFALTRRSQVLWQKLSSGLPANAEYRALGTAWVAADEEDLAEAERKHVWLAERNVPSRLLSPRAVKELEPNLRGGLAGGLLVPEDAVVCSPAVATYLARQAETLGAMLLVGRAVTRLENGAAELKDGTVLRAPRLVNALGSEAASCTPGAPIRKRKGHLAITAPSPGFVRHQVVELGYLKSAHAVSADSVAFNVQPLINGQMLIGSSRQFGDEDTAVSEQMLTTMLERATEYLPGLAKLEIVSARAGFRAATPDKLPLIGPAVDDSTVWLATGHEGLGITTALVTAELIAAGFTGERTAIPHEPYLPARFAIGATLAQMKTRKRQAQNEEKE